MNGPMLCKTVEPRSVSDRTHSHRLFDERHLPSHLACLAVIISNCFFSCPLPSNRQVRCLSQKCYGNGYLGQTETPRREAWGFVFPGCRSHLQSGLKKLAPCRLVGVRGETSDEGFMGARRSTETGSARWFLFPTKTWEPPLLTWVV